VPSNVCSLSATLNPPHRGKRFEQFCSLQQRWLVAHRSIKSKGNIYLQIAVPQIVSNIAADFNIAERGRILQCLISRIAPANTVVVHQGVEVLA
jgi:hypothetical protein